MRREFSWIVALILSNTACTNLRRSVRTNSDMMVLSAFGGMEAPPTPGAGWVARGETVAFVPRADQRESWETYGPNGHWKTGVNSSVSGGETTVEYRGEGEGWTRIPCQEIHKEALFCVRIEKDSRVEYRLTSSYRTKLSPLGVDETRTAHSPWRAFSFRVKE